MRAPSRQRGAALIVSLIMLVLITLLAITSFRLGKADVQIVGNMQSRSQALGAAQRGIETVISSDQFTQTPTDAIQNPCSGPNTLCVDVNGDGTPDVNVTVNPTCLSIIDILNSQLNWNLANDQACIASGNSDNAGTAGAPNGYSLCANTRWDTQATATDTVTNAQYVIDEGTDVRVAASAGNSLCP